MRCHQRAPSSCLDLQGAVQSHLDTHCKLRNRFYSSARSAEYSKAAADPAKVAAVSIDSTSQEYSAPSFVLEDSQTTVRARSPAPV